MQHASMGRALASREGTRGVGALVLAVVLGIWGVTVCAQDPAGVVTTRPEPRDGAWAKMHEEFLERTKSGPIDLLFLGDSITQGWANRGDLGPTELWERYYEPRNAANFGIGGDRTQHVLWRIQNGEVEGISPRVVVLMVGTNNIRSDTPGEIAEGIQAIVDTLRKKLPQTKILLLGVFPRGPRPDAVRDRARSINERIAKLDDGGTHVRFLDLTPHFVEPDGSISREVMPDFLHLSRKGYRIWAEAMEPTLWTLMER